ncbi:MAG: 3-dehydroquinate synthase [Thermodesulfobacteriota bacterium]
MKSIRIAGRNGSSEIVIGEQLANVRRYLPEGDCIIISDPNLIRLHGSRFPDAAVIPIGLGETCKTLETVRHIYEELIRLSADRSTFLLGIGGGIVCDVTGFAASTFMRGLPFGFVATTLLAQVDASVGGKNGVNLENYKNMIGVFNQPEFVICDLSLLQTLPERELRCGLAEIIKHGAIADPELFAFLETNHEKALALDPRVMTRLIYDSVVIKSKIVNQDETERGHRRLLNFGHTFGHALEKTTGRPHGEAVALGMAAAAALSVEKKLLSGQESARLNALIAACGLPSRSKTDHRALLEALGKDKKKAGGSIHFVLLKTIGEALVRELPMEELERFLRSFAGAAWD